MFKLCVAFAVIGCMATLIEGQNYYRQQAARLPFYQQQQYQQYQPFQQLRQQPYYQQNRYQQAAGFPFLGAQQRPGFYNPINAYNPNAYNRNFLNNNYYNRPSAAFLPQRAYSNEGLARTISQYKDARPDGSYEYSYETENGIRGAERNIPKSLRSGESSANAEGTYGYTSPEGLKVSVNYEADEDGFRPVLSYAGNGAAQFVNSPNPSSVNINRNSS